MKSHISLTIKGQAIINDGLSCIAPPAGLEPCFLNIANFNFSELSMLVELK